MSSERYTRDHLPVPVADMSLHRKVALTPMFGPIGGPCVIETQEGDYSLPDDWQGMLAVDKAGYPYPIEIEEYRLTYRPDDPNSQWEEIMTARERAHAKHGINSIENLPASDPRWLTILVEEIGEIANALTYDGPREKLSDELLDGLAVLSAWKDAQDGIRRLAT